MLLHICLCLFTPSLKLRYVGIPFPVLDELNLFSMDMLLLNLVRFNEDVVTQRD